MLLLQYQIEYELTLPGSIVSSLLPCFSQAMDPFLPASVFFFVLCFILVNGGGISAVLFGAAVVASLALLLHYFSFCFRVDLSQNKNRQRSAALALLLSLVFSSLVSWKIYSSLSRAVALVFFFYLLASLQLAAVAVFFIFSFRPESAQTNPC